MPRAEDIHVGQRVRHRRWMLGLTQQELGDLVGVKFQQLQKYESGQNRISASRIWDIANGLNVPVSFFFEGLGDAAAEMNNIEGDLLCDKRAAELVRSYYAIPEPKRDTLFNLAQILSEAS